MGVVMAYREKVQWIALLTMLLVWGIYFWRLGDALVTGRLAGFGEFVGAVILLVLLQVSATVAIALYRPSEAERPADPREREIECRAARIAYAVLSLGVVAIMLTAPLLTAIIPVALDNSTAMAPAMLIGNALLAALVIAALVNAAWQIALYRRHAV